MVSVTKLKQWGECTIWHICHI